MKFALHRQQLKSAMLPIAMMLGVIGYQWLGHLAFLSPYLIFLMLFITYCKLDPAHIKPRRLHWVLLSVQMLLSALIYFILLPIDHTLAEGVFICVFVPTATAAPVITAMLGGKISFVATYSLLCNTVVAIFGAAVLAAVGDNTGLGFGWATYMIVKKVFPLLILPLVAAILLRRLWPKAQHRIAGAQSLSFYLWAIALLLIVGNCVSFVIRNWDENQLGLLGLLVAGALGACLIQFWIGRKMGKDPGEKVTLGQSLMQKNTVLAVWLAMTYMTPLASVAPAAYIAWQNIVNSVQLMHKSSPKRATVNE